MKAKMLKVVSLVLAMLMILSSLVACNNATPGPAGEQGIQGEKGDTVSAQWGTITGTLANQEDLNNELSSNPDKYKNLEDIIDISNIDKLLSKLNLKLETGKFNYKRKSSNYK